MYTENTVCFDKRLRARTSYYVWRNSVKGRFIRLCLYFLLLISAIAFVVTFLRYLVVSAPAYPFVLCLLLGIIFLLFADFGLPLLFKIRLDKDYPDGHEQIVTMDAHLVNVYNSGSDRQYKWFNFRAVDEDERYYYLFTRDSFIILDKTRFPEGGEKIFKEFRVPGRLLREMKRKPVRERCFIILHVKPIFIKQ